MKVIAALLIVVLLNACENLADKQTGTTSSRDGTKIYYERIGNGQVPIVLIHGWCIDHSYWDSTVAALKDKYTVLTLDLAGHGKSGHGRVDYRVPGFAEDVLATMSATGIKKAILVGHSMAGDIMLAINEKAPERVIGLIGVDNFKNVGEEYNDTTERQFAEYMDQMKADYEGSNRFGLNNYLFGKAADTMHKKRVWKSILKTEKRVAISTMEELFEYGRERKSQIRNLDKPLQIISCSYYPSDTAALNNLLGDSYALYEMKCPGHYPMIQRPQAFNRNLEIAIESINY